MFSPAVQKFGFSQSSYTVDEGDNVTITIVKETSDVVSRDDIVNVSLRITAGNATAGKEE